MGERKVINKYYPPDFDPSKIIRTKEKRNDQIKIRSMLPMSVRCLTCGEYIYKGKKFNVRKETVVGEDYLGIKIFRFYYKCPRCSTEFTIKTDPKNADYVCEMGVTRNFEPWKETEKAIQEAKEERAKEEEGDKVKALENKTEEMKREIDILDALDEIRHMNAAAYKVNSEALWKVHNDKFEIKLTEEEEALVKSINFRNNGIIRRIEDDDDDEIPEGVELVEGEALPKRRKPTETLAPPAPPLVAPAQPAPKASAPAFKVIVKPKNASAPPPPPPAKPPAPPAAKEAGDKTASISMLADYGDDDD
jgi:DNA-directed RNA polymerase subunit RPC12/RpoP